MKWWAILPHWFKSGPFFLSAPFQHTFLNIIISKIYVLEHSVVCLMCSFRMKLSVSPFEHLYLADIKAKRSVFLKLSPPSIAPFFFRLEGIKTELNLSIHRKNWPKARGFKGVRVIRSWMLTSDGSILCVHPSVYRCLEDTSKQVIIMRWALQKLTLVSSLSVMVSRASRYSRESTS